MAYKLEGEGDKQLDLMAMPLNKVRRVTFTMKYMIIFV